jgi:hypothetical protein
MESLISNSSDINTRSEIFFENTYVVASESAIGAAVDKEPEGLSATSIGNTVRRVSLTANHEALPSIGEIIAISA